MGSRLHSSEAKGANPYWIVEGERGRLHFALEWCGGWEAELGSSGDRLNFAIRMPPEETRLVLAPGETIEGPAVWIASTSDADGTIARATWMNWRSTLRKTVYKGPAPSYPLAYNHWYALHFKLDAEVLRRQLEAALPYGFDAFIIDAGWYEKYGDWTPAEAKFQPGEFEGFLRGVKERGIKAGVWSCPQFISADADRLPPEVDRPGHYSKFLNAHLLDMCVFKERLPAHVELLRRRYSVDWWKYDQAFFTAETRAGVMKNVAIFQDALRDVRRLHPDLVIENCQSGGRMINEFTALLADVHWLRDGGGTGLKHARQNVETALGAMEFLFPWTAFRWTNNPDQMDPNDDELTRLYCRSAMAGVWGISADLPKIAPRQRAVILTEIGNYRRLHQLHSGALYDLAMPRAGAETAGVTFYDPSGKSAGVLLYRWDRASAFEHRLVVQHLRDDWWYRVRDTDLGTSVRVQGKMLRRGIAVRFAGDRRGTIQLVESGFPSRTRQSKRRNRLAS